jgi:hypothetical protein
VGTENSEKKLFREEEKGAHRKGTKNAKINLFWEERLTAETHKNHGPGGFNERSPVGTHVSR